MPDLTAPQRRALQFVNDNPPNVAPRQLAMLMWPDSPGWEKRSRRGSTPAGGALGATMPMKGATMLWRLRDKGLVRLSDTILHAQLWEITAKGQEALK